MTNKLNWNSKNRVTIATSETLANLIPDVLYSRMGGVLAWYCEDGIIEEQRHFENLEWIARYLGALAEHRVISTDTAESLVRAFVGQLVIRNFPRPTDASEIVHEWLQEGRRQNIREVMSRLRQFADDRHRPSLPSPGSSAPAGRPAQPSSAPRAIQPTPFVLQDPSTLPRREWLYGTHLIRKEISATLAPGGVGKTSLGVAEAVAIATGRPLLGVHVAKPLRVWLWNGEEPQEELMRRLHAVCLHYGVTPDALGGRLMVDNGHDLPLVLAEQTRDGTTVYEPRVEALVAALKGRGVDVMICDPFVSTHNVTENDNNAIQKAATAWKSVAVSAEVAISLAHHTRKLNGREATTEDARGADSLIAKCRDARALNPMSENEAKTLGVAPAERFEFFWTGPGGKSNMAKRTGHKTWFHMVSVGLGNGRSLTEPEDKIGVVEGWKPDYSAEEISADAIDRLQTTMTGREWRAADQSAHDPNWIGVAVAQAFGIDRDDGPWIGKAKKMTRRLEAEGFLVRHKVQNEHRKPVPVFVFNRPEIPEDEATSEAA